MGSKLRGAQGRWARLWLSVVTVLALTASTEAADVYRWVDENGRVHYSDQPHHGGEKPVRVAPATPRDPDLAERQQRQQRLLQIYAEDREREEAAKRKQQAERLERERRCRQARYKVARIEQGGVFYQFDADGERRYLSEQDVEARKSRRRSEVSKWCGES